jgi:hypothetical protein
MSSARNPGDDARHRFFNAMVLMGGSLALGCGGATTSDPSASGGAAAGGAPASGGLTGTGGVSGNGSGGVIVISQGGTAVAGPFDCPPPQWDCSANPPSCWDAGYALPAMCACDPKRPLTAADCEAGTDWVCRIASYDPEHRGIDRLPFECACVPHQMDCGLACDQVFDYAGRCTITADGNTKSILCDCAVVVLR